MQYGYQQFGQQVVLPQGFAMPQQPYAVAQPGFHAGVPFAQAGRPIHQQQWVHAAPPGAPPDDFMVGTEKAIRKDYDPETREWKRSAIVVRVAKQPFSSGSMRHAFKMEDLTLGEGPHTEFVAKMSKDPRESRQVYFDDVQMQMEAKGWADRFNERFGRKVVDFLVAYVAELVERPGRPHGVLSAEWRQVIGVEKMVQGNYVKYNNNWDWSDEQRNTPQAFSHFTWEESKHRVLVCDLQGVGDSWTDPQIHSADGRGYGKGNMGMRGIKAFLNNHRCNAICAALSLPQTGKTPKENNHGTMLQPVRFRPDQTFAQCRAAQVQAEVGAQGRKMRGKKGAEAADRLSVQVLDAQLDPSATGRDAIDTSVVLICGEKSVETKVAYGTAAPEWNERFQLILEEDRQVEEMVAVVFVATEAEPEVLGIVRARFDLLQDDVGYDDRKWPLRPLAERGSDAVGTLHLKIMRFKYDISDVKEAAAAPAAAAAGAARPPAQQQPPRPAAARAPAPAAPVRAQGAEPFSGGIKVMVREARGLRAVGAAGEGSGGGMLFVHVTIERLQARTRSAAVSVAQGCRWDQKMAFGACSERSLIDIRVVEEGSNAALATAQIQVNSLSWDAAGHAVSWVTMKDTSGAAGASPELYLEAWERQPAAPAPAAPRPAQPVGTLSC